MFLKQAPNLQNLTISSKVSSMIDAYGWQDLIKTSLPFLNIFKFKFVYSHKDNDIMNKFQQFQNKFWQDKHHWYTEYVLDTDSAYIYTLPYISNTYTLTPNLTNIKHLNISSKCTTDIMIPLLLAILKQSPQFSSLTIVSYALPLLFTNDELCGYLNKMIKLDIYIKNDDTLHKSDIIIKFCRVFLNLEQLKCNIRQLKRLLFLLNNLLKLTFLNVIVAFRKLDIINQIKNKLSN